MDMNVPQGHVALVLLRNGDRDFYLQIPLNIVNNLCLRPLKYFHYLGWCILGAEGVLSLEFNGNGIDTNGVPVDQQIYYYVPYCRLEPNRVVDLEVIKARTNVPSETSRTREDFRTRLLERDVCCVWSGTNRRHALHIIPFKRGSEWLRLIIANRLKYRENLTTLNSINDIRNGIIANPHIHDAFDERDLVVLKTPNHILQTDDIPPRSHRQFTSPAVSYPTHDRYTLQWLEPQDAISMSFFPNNMDAAFKNNFMEKPSALLLHYNYSAAAVKKWGRGKEVLLTLTNPPRPAGPSKAIHNSEAARNRGGAGAGAGGLVESEGEAMWDEDDVMLFFWGNTQAANDRHLKKASEDTRRIEQWRDGVPQGSV